MRAPARKNPGAVALGSIRSPRKAASSAANGRLGGRPPKFTIDQLRAGYARNAEQLTAMAIIAISTGRTVNGFTAAQLEERAAEYRRLATADDATVRAHVTRRRPAPEAGGR